MLLFWDTTFAFFNRWNALTRCMPGRKCRRWATRTCPKWRSPTGRNGLGNFRHYRGKRFCGYCSSRTSALAACTPWSSQRISNRCTSTTSCRTWTSGTSLACCSCRSYCSATCPISSTWPPCRWWPTGWWPAAWASRSTICCATCPASRNGRRLRHWKHSRRFSVSLCSPWRPSGWYVLIFILFQYWFKVIAMCKMYGKNSFLQNWLIISLGPGY